MIFTFVMALAPCAAISAGLILLRSIPATFLLFHGLVCLAVPGLHLALRGGRDFGPRAVTEILGLSPGRTPLLKAIAAGVTMGGLIYLAFMLLRGRVFQPEMLMRTLGAWGVERGDILWFTGIMVFLNSFLEEVYWRGYMAALFTQRYTARTTVLLTALFYSSYHGITTGILFSPEYSLISVAVVFCAGLLWGWARFATESIWSSVITHLLADMGIMLVYLNLAA